MHIDHFKMLCEIKTNLSHETIETFAIATVGNRPSFQYCIIEKIQEPWSYIVSVKNLDGKTIKGFNITLPCIYPLDLVSIITHLSKYEFSRLESSIKKHYELFINEDKFLHDGGLNVGTLNDLINAGWKQLKD